MKLNDFRIGWRTLVQEPAYSLVVILGLGVGLAASLLLFGFVQYSWQYNASVPDVDKVYVVKHRANTDPRAPWYDQVPMFLRHAAQKTQGVAAAVAYLPSRPNETGFTVSIDGKLSQLASLTATPGFAEMLGLQATRGTPFWHAGCRWPFASGRRQSSARGRRRAPTCGEHDHPV